MEKQLRSTICMMASMSMTRSMAMESFTGSQEINTWVIIIKMRGKAMELWNGVMEAATLAIGKMEFNMA